MHRNVLMALAIGLAVGLPANAGIRTKAIQEAFEFVSKKFGKEVAEEGIENVSTRMMRLAATHGDEVVAKAFRRVGPRAGKIVGEAGERGGLAIRLLATHGDQALPLVTKQATLQAVSRYGDDAVTAVLKHGSIGEQLIEQFAEHGAHALAGVTPQNGRRLAMMAADGALKPELLTVVSRYGDEACDFIWRNKGALATGAALATFVASPEPYLQGAERLTATVADAAVKPLADVPGIIAAEAAANTNWTPIVAGLLIAAAVFAGWQWSKWKVAKALVGTLTAVSKEGPSRPHGDH